MSARMRTMSVSFSPFSFLERSRPLYFRGIWRARSRKYLKQLLFLAFLSLKGTKWEWPPIGRRMERSRPKCQREWTFYKGSKDPHSPLGFLGGGGKLFKGKVLCSQGGWTQALEPQHTPPKHGIEGTALGLILLIVLFKWSESKMNSFLLYRSVSFNTCIGSCNQDGEQFLTLKTPLRCPFIVTACPHPQPHKITGLCAIIIVLLYEMVRKMESYSRYPSETGFCHSGWHIWD